VCASNLLLLLPNGKRLNRNVLLADVIRICDFGANTKVNMAAISKQSLNKVSFCRINKKKISGTTNLTRVQIVHE
jgi:hypothetical protein